MDRRTLRAFVAPRPVNGRFYRAAPRIKSSEVVPETIDANVALALLLAEPLLIRPPLMQCDERRVVGFNAALCPLGAGSARTRRAPDMPHEGYAAMTDHSSHQRASRCAPSTSDGDLITMPLYDYRCTACSHAFETLVRAGHTPVCPQCGGTALDKQVSAPASPGKSRAIISCARRQAAREGHLSNYSPAERCKLLR